MTSPTGSVTPGEEPERSALDQIDLEAVAEVIEAYEKFYHTGEVPDNEWKRRWIEKHRRGACDYEFPLPEGRSEKEYAAPSPEVIAALQEHLYRDGPLPENQKWWEALASRYRGRKDREKRFKVSVPLPEDLTDEEFFGRLGYGIDLRYFYSRRLMKKLNEAMAPLLDNFTDDHRSSSKGQPTKSTRREVMRRDERTCQECGRAWEHPNSHYERREDKAELDHLIPVMAGGPGKAWNLQVLCHRCNHVKGSGMDPTTLRLAILRSREE